MWYQTRVWVRSERPGGPLRVERHVQEEGADSQESSFQAGRAEVGQQKEDGYQATGHMGTSGTERYGNPVSR